MYISDSPPQPLSQQQFVDCTVGLEAGAGTEMVRSNQGCVSGFPDVHLKYVEESGDPLQSPEEYPLTFTVGTCQRPYTYYSPYEDYLRPNNRQGSATVSTDQWKFFSTEDDLFEMLQSGPVVTNIDVGPDFQFYYKERSNENGGVFYDVSRCVNYFDEQPIPEECQEGSFGYTCLGDCKKKLPNHCDR